MMRVVLTAALMPKLWLRKLMVVSSAPLLLWLRLVLVRWFLAPFRLLVRYAILVIFRAMFSGRLVAVGVDYRVCRRNRALVLLALLIILLWALVRVRSLVSVCRLRLFRKFLTFVLGNS